MKQFTTIIFIIYQDGQYIWCYIQFNNIGINKILNKLPYF